MIGLKGRRVFLTGGSRGIGKCIRNQFENFGAEVIAPSRSELDLSDPVSIRTYLSQNPQVQPNIFIHCAGINPLAGIDQVNGDMLNHAFQVNCFSSVELIQSFSDSMRESKWGRIVFISSLYALVSKEKRLAYCSSKNALTGLMKTLALEFAPDNILVNCVAPGYVMTDMSRQNLSLEEISHIQSMIPTGRFQTEEDIANLVMFLCSDYNQSITGQLIPIDGGFTCR